MLPNSRHWSDVDAVLKYKWCAVTLNVILKVRKVKCIGLPFVRQCHKHKGHCTIFEEDTALNVRVGLGT